MLYTEDSPFIERPFSITVAWNLSNLYHKRFFKKIEFSGSELSLFRIEIGDSSLSFCKGNVLHLTFVFLDAIVGSYQVMLFFIFIW